MTDNKNFEIDIRSCDKDKKFISAYIYDKDNKSPSFWVITAPHQLIYCGNAGDFIFSRTSEEQMLNQFNSKYPEYQYWSEKLQAGVSSEERYNNKKKIVSSIMNNILLDYDISLSERLGDKEEYEYSDIRGILQEVRDVIIYDTSSSLLNTNLLDIFEDLIYFDIDESESIDYNVKELSKAVHHIFTEEDLYRFLINKDFTLEFKRCCDNLKFLARDILEYADRYIIEKNFLSVGKDTALLIKELASDYLGEDTNELSITEKFFGSKDIIEEIGSLEI